MAFSIDIAPHSILPSVSGFSLHTPFNTKYALRIFPAQFKRAFLVESSLNIRDSRKKPPTERLRVAQAIQKKDETVKIQTVVDEKQELTPHRKDFPEDFLFGFATSAFQWEGELLGGGRGLSIWDTFAQIPGKITDGSTPNVGCNGYHKYLEDLKNLKKTGATAFRFSISWSRLLPDGKNINPEGLAFYNRLISDVISEGLTPLVTLYHWDLPLILENDPKVLGWRTKNIVEYFALYADTCFKHFGDRVKLWITFNEIYSFSIYGYGYGQFAPGRCSEESGSSCPQGDSSTEPYIVTHNVLLSHAAAAKIYKRDYQKEQNGKIGVTNVSLWCEPYDSKSANDAAAAQRCLEFQTGWFWDPIFFGDYPQSMRLVARERLPEFTPEESKALIGSVDFLGINYYFATYARNAESVGPSKRWWLTDTNTTMSVYGPDGKPIGDLFANTSFPMPLTAWGLQKLLAWMANRYGSTLPIYVTENGCADSAGSASLTKVPDDQATRVKYLREHLVYLARSINDDKCNVKGYMVWSLLDGWEWSSGFDSRFGVYYTDTDDADQKRIAKASVAWLTDFLSEEESDVKKSEV